MGSSPSSPCSSSCAPSSATFFSSSFSSSSCSPSSSVFSSSSSCIASKKEPTDSQLAEYKQDFIDFDLNQDNMIDAQEVRLQFKGDLDPRELQQFFLDVDKDSTGTVTLQEYVD